MLFSKTIGFVGRGGNSGLRVGGTIREVGMEWMQKREQANFPYEFTAAAVTNYHQLYSLKHIN